MTVKTAEQILADLLETLPRMMLYDPDATLQGWFDSADEESKNLRDEFVPLFGDALAALEDAMKWDQERRARSGSMVLEESTMAKLLRSFMVWPRPKTYCGFCGSELHVQPGEPAVVGPCFSCRSTAASPLGFAE